MNAIEKLEAIRRVIAGDEDGEIQSCADAIQEIGLILRDGPDVPPPPDVTIATKIGRPRTITGVFATRDGARRHAQEQAEREATRTKKRARWALDTYEVQP